MNESINQPNNKPTILTLFGASGDLARLKIFPAIYTLAIHDKLPENFSLVGYGRTQMSIENFRDIFKNSIRKNTKDEVNESSLNQLAEKVHYFSGHYDDLQDFEKLRVFSQKLCATEKKIIQIAYFSVPPTVFHPIIENLAKSRENKDDDIRLVLEKPFGMNAKSAQNLYKFISSYFDRRHIYLLDHYLGKRSVQSILSLRRSKKYINSMLSGDQVASISITISQDIGVENRIGYFDHVGIIRDFVQSHILQILALLTMTLPCEIGAHDLGRAKNSILSALKFVREKKNIVLGQYASYCDHKDVPANSKTETFVALKFFINQQDWQNVPIYIRVGKKLDKKQTRIVIELKNSESQNDPERPDEIVIELQPNERLGLKFLYRLKADEMKSEKIDFKKIFPCDNEICLSEHAFLISEIVNGKKNNFLSFDEVLTSWKFVDTVLTFAEESNVELMKYADGSDIYQLAFDS